MRSLLLLKMQFHLLGVHQRRNQDSNKGIDDFCCLECHFNRIRAGEINFCGLVVSVCAAVSDVFHRVEDFFDFRLQLQCSNLLPEPGISLVVRKRFHFSNRVAQSFKTSAKKSTGRPGGLIRDSLSFNEKLFHCFRHVLTRLNAKRFGVENFFVFPD